MDSSLLVECAGCGSTRLAWRVRRIRGAHAAAPRRTLVWTCRDCGAGWEDAPAQGAGPEAGAQGAERLA